MLLTEGYREQQRKLHEDPNYGTASVAYAAIVAGAMNIYRPSELLDYGAGKQRLKEAIEPRLKRQVNYRPYEPADPQCCERPHPSQFVACVDVLEHIEPECLDAVLDDLKRVTKRAGVFTVSTVPAMKVLPDGRNAHLIVKPLEWWLPKFMDRFLVYTMQRLPDGFFVVVERRPDGNHNASGTAVSDRLAVETG